MSAGQMKDWLLNVISERQLTERQYSELKSVLNVMYDYATSYNITPVNIPMQIRKPSEKMFKNAEEKPLDIVRTEIKGYWKDADGTYHRSGYKVVNRVKTKCGIRNLCLTPNAMKYIQMAIERNRKLGISD